MFLPTGNYVRGRVFSVYDMLVNVSYVLALLAAAYLLPADGVSPPAVVAIGAAYVLTALHVARSPLAGRGLRAPGRRNPGRDGPGR